MRVLYIYNQNNSKEASLIDRVKNELAECVEEVLVGDSQDFKDIYKISSTPALIILRDDLQGAQLLSEGTDGKLLITGEVNKAYDLESQAIHNAPTGRMDNMINAEIQKVTTPLQDQLLLSQNQLTNGGIF